MTAQPSTVVLMCGLPGAGKTTYATELVRRGYVRLSIDEVVRQRLGGRDDHKALVERHGCRWELVHLEADRATLERRLAVRNDEDGADSVTVDEELFHRYPARFEEPEGEGEQVVRPPSA